MQRTRRGARAVRGSGSSKEVTMRRLVMTIAAGLLLVNSTSSLAGVAFKIVTASERGTYHVIGHDLAKFVAPAAGIDLEVVPTSGSATVGSGFHPHDTQVFAYCEMVLLQCGHASCFMATRFRAGACQARVLHCVRS